MNHCRYCQPFDACPACERAAEDRADARATFTGRRQQEEADRRATARYEKAMGLD